MYISRLLRFFVARSKIATHNDKGRGRPRTVLFLWVCDRDRNKDDVLGRGVNELLI